MRSLFSLACTLFVAGSAHAELRCRYSEVEVVDVEDHLTHQTRTKPGRVHYTTTSAMTEKRIGDDVREHAALLTSSTGRPIAFLFRVDGARKFHFNVDLGEGASFSNGTLVDSNFDSGLVTSFGWKEKFGQQYRCHGSLE